MEEERFTTITTPKGQVRLVSRCPCGSVDLDWYDEQMESREGKSYAIYRIYCMTCGMESPPRRNLGNARRAWNTRRDLRVNREDE